MDIRDIKRQIKKIEAHLQATSPLSFGKRNKYKIQIQALEEAGRDILSTEILNRGSGKAQIGKNNYRTYEKQVDIAYKMYNAQADFGSEILGGLIDIRTAFLVGEGISFTLSKENKEKEDFLNTFIEKNKLDGSRLIDLARYTEIEGKILINLLADKTAKNEKDYYIKTSLFPWRDNKYKVIRNDSNKDEVLKFTYIVNNEQKTIEKDKSIYIKTSGIGNNDDEASSKICKVLTQLENASRAAFDLRSNTHLFGRIFPYWRTDSPANAKAINDALRANSFELGDSYAGPAELKLMEPTGSAATVIKEDLLLNLRFVSSMISIPIHWMAWPDLMSNRATADNLLEITSAGTKNERLILQEGLEELLNKVCELGVDELGKDKSLLDGDITVTLPLISLAEVQKLIDVWMPIYQDGELLSRESFMAMLPGINVSKEKKLIEKEKKEKAKNPTLKNRTTDNTLLNAQKDKLNIDKDNSNNENQGE